jgi:hypothetical protein
MVDRSMTHAAVFPLSTLFLASRARCAGLHADSEPVTVTARTIAGQRQSFM